MNVPSRTCVFLFRAWERSLRSLRLSSYSALLGRMLVVIGVALMSAASDAVADGCLGHLAPPPAVRSGAASPARCASNQLVPLPRSDLQRGPVGSRIVNSHLERRSDFIGRWSGKLVGVGRARVYLQIIDRAQLISESSVGEFELQGKPLDIIFEGPLPQNLSPEWTWRFEAR